MDYSLKLELSSHPQLMGVVRSAVERFVSDVGFDQADARAIVLALDEALTNVIRHAYDNRYDRPIAVTLRRLEPANAVNGASGIEFIVEDHGMSADPAKLRGRPLEEVRPGGLGVHLICEIMDSFRYEPSATGNKMILRKLRGQKPSTGG